MKHAKINLNLHFCPSKYTNKWKVLSSQRESERCAPQKGKRNPKRIPMRMRNARNSIPNVFYAKGCKKKKLPSHQGGEKLQLHCMQWAEGQSSRARSSGRRAGGTTPGHIHMPHEQCHVVSPPAMVAHFAVTNNNKNAISRRSINKQLHTHTHTHRDGQS